MTFTLHFINLIFVTFGITDFKRKLFVQKIMGSLINAERQQSDQHFIKFTPIINFVNPNYLKRWMTLRKTALDLGEKYTQRVFMFTSSFIIIYGTLAVIFTLTFFKILKYEIPLPVIILGYYDIIVILGFILQMIRVGAEVNNQFRIHKEILMKTKRNFINVRINYEALAKKKTFNSD